MNIAILLILAATTIPVPEFRSVELRNGGHVTLRHGAVQRVSVVEGDPKCTRVRVDDGQRLVIDRAKGGCPHGSRRQIEIVTPHLSAVSVSNGGTIEADGPFPGQKSIEAAVEQGGTVDIRAIAADDVDASVYSGGGILITSRNSLVATVRSGGSIRYWGEVEDVTKSVRDGGVVARGSGRP